MHAGQLRVQRDKGRLRAFGLWIGLVAAVVLQDGFGGVQSMVGHQLRHQRADLLFQRLDLAAIDGQFGEGAVGIDLVPVEVEKLAHAVAHDGLRVALRELHGGTLQEVAHAADQRVVVDDVAQLRVADGELSGQLHALGFLQIGRAREAQRAAERLPAGPSVHHLAQFDVAVRSVMHLVDVDGQAGQAADDVAQLVGRADALLFLAAEELAVRVLPHAVQDDLLGIGHRHQSHQLVQRLVLADFLRVGVAHQVALLRGLLLVQHLELDEPLQARGGGFGDDPRGVEVADIPQAGHDGRFQSRRGQYQEVVGKGGIVRLGLCEVQVQVDEGRHQVRLSRTHGEAEQVVRIVHTVEQPAEGLFVVDFSRLLADEPLQLGGQLAAVAVLQARIFQQGDGGRGSCQHLARGCAQRQGVQVQAVESALHEQLPQRGVAARYLQVEVGTDGLQLCIAQQSAGGDIVRQFPHRAPGRGVPLISFLFYQFIKHTGITISMGGQR